MSSLGSATPRVAFTPAGDVLGPVSFVIECAVGGGTPLLFEANACIEAPRACFDACVVDLGRVHRGVLATGSAILRNLSRLALPFTVRVASLCPSLRVVPDSGVLGPADSVNLTISCAPTRVGEVADMLLVCTVAGIADPLLVRVTAALVGLDLRFAVEHDAGDLASLPGVAAAAAMTASSASSLAVDGGNVAGGKGPPVIDFQECPIRTRASRHVGITNITPVTSTLSLRLACQPLASDLRHGAPASPGEPSTFGTVQSTRMKSICLAQTGSRSLVPSALPSPGVTQMSPLVTLRGAASAVRSGVPPTRPSVNCGPTGVAFQLDQAQVHLAAHGSAVVVVSCYADLFGAYSTSLVCEDADGVCVAVLPIKATVIGSPLVLSVAGATLTAPIIRFPATSAVVARGPGAVAEAVTPVRSVRVDNPTALDMTIAWSTFLVTPDDAQLLDSLVSVDQTGRVVVRTRPHTGNLCSEPFAVVSAMEEVIPAGEARTVDVRFASREVGDFRGFVRGVITLASEYLKPLDAAGGLGIERTGFVAESFAVQAHLQGVAVAAELVPQLEGGIFELRGLAHDALVAPQTKHVVRKTLLLANLTAAALTCRVHTGVPFRVLSIRTGESTTATPPSATSGAVSGLLREPGAVTIPSRGLVEVTVEFAFTLNQVRSWLLTATPQGSPALVQSDAVAFSFANGSIQSVPVRGVIELPRLSIDTQMLDLGLCRVGERVIRSLHLVNGGVSPASWAVRVAGSEPCIALSPTSGTIEGFVNLASKTTGIVDIEVAPTAAVAIDAVVEVLDSVSGTVVWTVAVRGEGTLDEAVSAARPALS